MPPLCGVDVERDLVLLDIGRDAYLCLPGAGPAWRAARRSGPGSAHHPPLRERLAGAGLSLEALAPPTPPPSAPTRRIAPVAAGARWSDALRLALAYGDLWRGYRGQSFGDILAFVRRSPAHPTSADAAELARLCEVFQRLAVWLPISDKCLERSFLLLRFLQRGGYDARWRFGVRLWPFAAHCWLQVGETALDEWPERLAAYATIHDG